MDFSDFLACMIGLAVVGGSIVLLVYLAKNSSDKVRQAEIAHFQMFRRLPTEKQMLFMMQYNSAKKNSTTALLLALFLGGLGFHKFYMGQAGMGIVYLLFCWTGIPAIIALIDAIAISGQVAKYNQKKAREIIALIGGGVNPNMLPR